MILASSTVEAIDSAIEADGGAKFRVLQRKAFSELTDAFSDKEEAFRTHLGASKIGHPCARDIWYGWHWVKKPSFSGRLLRLFNTGHLYEARFIAMLRLIGAQVWTAEASGRQFRFTAANGHFGGSLDAVVQGIPDRPDIPMLAEFKTHNNKSFVNLVEEGVAKAKWEHYVQMSVYANAHGLSHCLYLAANKDTDALYGEIVVTDPSVAEKYAQRAQMIIDSPEPPSRINESPGWYQCRYCDHKTICHDFAMPEVNCRTCSHATPVENGLWKCERHDEYLTKDCTACPEYVVNLTLLNGIEVLDASQKENWVVYKKKDGEIVDTRHAAP
jgi:hypothetical protein